MFGLLQFALCGAALKDRSEIIAGSECGSPARLRGKLLGMYVVHFEIAVLATSLPPKFLVMTFKTIHIQDRLSPSILKDYLLPHVPTLLHRMAPWPSGKGLHPTPHTCCCYNVLKG